MDWQTKTRQRLQSAANAAFHAWCSTAAGKRWKRRKLPGSPYRAGFSLPDWHHDVIQALNDVDEERVKYLIHVHLLSGMQGEDR